ncbi:MAG: LamG domain-containing protein, partial [Planctomycetota bacterium]
MSKQIILLTVLGLMLAVTGSASAAFQLKVDLCFRFGDDPDPDTWKGSDPGFEDWMAWPAYADSEKHDARNVYDVGGSGIHVGIASAPFGSHQTFNKSLGGEDKICNSWIVSDENAGDPQSNTHLVLWANDGLIPGSYVVYGYHNHPGGGEPNMPIADARAYCEDNYFNVYDPERDNIPFRDHIDNIGKAGGDGLYDAIGDLSQYPCDSVISDVNDYNVPIQHEANDVNLVPSEIQFTTDGSPVWIMYHAGAGSHSILNAFILEVRAIGKQTSGPSPQSDFFDVCPDVTLYWQEGAYGPENDLYLGTDFNDVNDANTAVPLDVYVDRLDDPCYEPPGLLELGTTYYWRVDAVNDANGESPWKGKVWNFTTDSGKAYAPNPSDSSFSVNIYPTLNWSASCLANSHDVYFGDDLEDVNNATTSTAGIFKINQGSTSYFAGIPALQNAKQYYWRVDERTDAGIVKGDLWRFFTYGGTLFLYDFDGVADANIHDPCDEERITDSTGNVVFDIRGGGNRFVYGESNPLVNPIGTSATFDDVALYRGERSSPRVRGIDITDLITPQYTIEMWIKMADFDTMGLFRKWDRSYGLETDDQYLNFWQAGSDPISSDSNNPMELDVWYHVAAVFDSEDPCEPQKLYIDGDLVASGGTANLNPDNDDDPATIGCSVIPLRIGFEKTRDQFEGLIDELRVSDLALLPPQFRMRGDPALAWMPRPKDGAREIEYDVEFKWKPGDWADSHDIYFGTAYDDVNDANTLTALIYKTTKGPNDYTPDQLLDLDTIYYWRIDEVNDSNGYRWKGTTWMFTVANYVVIDDFEDYTYPPDNLWYTWENPHWTGSFAELGREPYDPVNRGHKSMKFSYDITEYGWAWYAEVERHFLSPQDWDSTGVKILTLYFYGQAGNDANSSEQMSVGLEDGDSNSFVDYDGDTNDIKIEEWQEWNIKLSDFTGVDMTDVRIIYIRLGDPDAVTPGGSGIVYFDDVRIYPPKCVPSEGPAYDFDDDCIVGFGEIAMMGDEWLIRDRYVPIEAPSPTSVLRYQFDESGGSDLEDSAGDYDGLFITDVNWGPNDISVHMDSESMSGNSFHFFQNGDVNDGPIVSTGGIMIPPEVWTDNGISQEITVAMWIKNVHTDEDPTENDAYIFEFREWDGASPDANDSVLSVRAEDDQSEFRFEDRSESVTIDIDWDEITEWTHYAFVRDADNLKIYVNGYLEDVSDSNGSPMADPNLLYIGIAADRAWYNEDNLHDEFTGNMDNFEIYNYALNDAQAGHLGTGGTGYVRMPPTTMNLLNDEDDGEKAVNFRDYAELML